MRPFAQQFQYNVEQYGDGMAAADAFRRLNYAQLDALSGQIAALLRRKGIGREDVVAIHLPRRVEYLAAEIAVMRVGAAFVPLDMEMPDARVKYILSDCGCSFVLDEAACEAALRETPLKDWAKTDPHDLALLIYTSGSTGKPKGVMLEYAAWDMIAWTIDEFQGPFSKGPEGSPLNVALMSPMMYVATLYTVIPAIYEGNALHILTEDQILDSASVLEYFRRERIGHTFMTASLYRQFPFAPDLNLRTVFIGGEPASELMPRGFTLFNCYSMSEFGCGPFSYRVETQREQIPLGKCSDLVRVCLLDADGEVSATEGTLCIRLPWFRGYRNLPEMTEKAFVDIGGERYFNTNDIMRLDGEGNYVLVGRADNIVKINGNRVEPEEVERTLLRLLPEIREAAVLSFQNRWGGSYLCAFYTADSELSPGRFREVLSSAVADYMIPRFFVRLEKMPRGGNGKIDRRAFAPPPAESRLAEYAAPENDLERELCRGFALALEMEDIGILDDFYELGGDSLATMKLVTELRIPGISFARILEGRTPRGIAALCSARGLQVSDQTSDATYRTETRRDYPLRPIQRWICDLQRKHPESTAWNLPGLMRVDDALDFERLTSAVRTVLARHDVYGIRYFLSPNTGVLRQRFVPEREPLEIEEVSEEEFERIRAGLVRHFTLLDSPLYRARALRAPSGNYLFMDTHHSITDGGSIRIYFREIEQLYLGEVLPEVHSYAAVIEEELSWLRREGIRSDRAYWADILRHYDEERSLLPFDRDTGRDEEGEMFFPIHGIQEQCFDGRGYSENVFFLTAAALSLARVLRLRKLVMAWVHNGRDSASKVDAIGLLIHELPIYFDLSREITLEELFAETQENILGALRHLDGASTVYRTLTDRVNCFLFQQNIHDAPTVDGRELRFVPVAGEEATASNILDLELMKKDEGYLLFLDFDRGLYLNRTMARLGGIYVQTAEYMWTHPGTSIAEILALVEP